MRALLSSLSAMLAALARPRTPLAKAIMFVLVVKLIGIIGIRMWMFSPSARPMIDPDAMARVIGAAPNTK